MTWHSWDCSHTADYLWRMNEVIQAIINCCQVFILRKVNNSIDFLWHISHENGKHLILFVGWHIYDIKKIVFRLSCFFLSLRCSFVWNFFSIFHFTGNLLDFSYECIFCASQNTQNTMVSWMIDWNGTFFFGIPNWMPNSRNWALELVQMILL